MLFDGRKIIELDNWGVGSVVGLHSPPDGMEIRIHGNVKNHPVFDDGQYVITQQIIAVDGKYVEAKGGIVYRLVRIHPLYRRWLKIHRGVWDWQNPITLKYSHNKIHPPKIFKKKG